MSARWPIRIGLAILALGTGPLLLYAIFGPADGNPIGLGLLFILTFPFAAAFLGWGGFLRFLGRGRKAVAPAVDPRVTSREHPDNWS